MVLDEALFIQGFLCYWKPKISLSPLYRSMEWCGLGAFQIYFGKDVCKETCRVFLENKEKRVRSNLYTLHWVIVYIILYCEGTLGAT